MGRESITMKFFNQGDTVTFRESESGPAERGTINEVLAPSDQHPDGGIYKVALVYGTTVEAFWVELTAGTVSA